MEKYKKIVIIVCVCMMLLGIGCVIPSFFITKQNNGSVSFNSLLKQIEPFEKLDPVYERYKDEIDEYQTDKYLNESVVARIFFDSGLINKTVVQGQTNNTFLRIDYKTNKYDEGGSIFLDYRNKMDDQNLIIYGHNYWEGVTSHDPMFTYLHKLEKPEDYSENKIINLIVGNEVRVFEVAYVYLADIAKDKAGEYTVINDGIYYYCPSFSKNQSDSNKNTKSINDFDEYIKKIEEKKLYDTNIKLEFNDKMLTLQTCCSDESKRLIVVAKQINTLVYSLPSYIDYSMNLVK